MSELSEIFAAGRNGRMMNVSQFVLDDPKGLSKRAVRFLAMHGGRQPYDPGPTGEVLRRRLSGLLEPAQRDEVAALLDRVQRRWGGLAYRSRLFGDDIRFAPSFDLEDVPEPLEIEFAIETNSAAGASLALDGSVLIGFDAAGVREFSDLNGVIECDAMAEEMATTMSDALTIRGSQGSGSDFISRIGSHLSGTMELVREASGNNLHWYRYEISVIHLCSTWALFGLGLAPYAQIWGTDARRNRALKESLARLL
ncbi:hypothetical protein ACQPW3_22440 [Actinosynnema sp. CA-248983]